MSEPSRNVELKALDPDPARTLERALAEGAEDRGVIVQRDTYFKVAGGRLKLREEDPGEAHLIAYRRPDEAAVRVSDYRVVPAPEGLRTALEETLEVDVVVEKRRRLLLWDTVRIHLDEVEGLGSFLELEAVAGAGSDLSREREQVARLRVVLGVEDGALREGSYSDAVRAAVGGTRPRPSGSRDRALSDPDRDALSDPDRDALSGPNPDAPAGPDPDAPPDPDPKLLALAREAARRAYAPYSGFPVGAAVRTADGRRYAGANVENAVYPQGQCAEASALGAMVAGGGGRVVEVVVAAPAELETAPCGGCRQRLREFADDDAPIHLADLERVRRTTSLAELLPLSFGPKHLA